MRVPIDIDIETARNALYISCGSYEASEIVLNMSDEEVVDAVLKHCKCWGIWKAGEN